MKDPYRRNLKELLKKLIGLRPQVFINIIKSASQLKIKESINLPKKKKCENCGKVFSHKM